ncbi:MAG: SRPBCC family protein [Pseudomonadota bacterium]
MIIEMSQKTNVSADKLWQVFGEQYPDIAKWSRGVYASKPRDGKPTSGAPFAGRLCETSFGKLTETVEHYDPDSRKIAYLVNGEKMPPFVKRMENNWHFRDLGNGVSEISMRLNGKLSFPFNILMGWMMKIQLKKDLRTNIEDLVHFAENDRPHPQKDKVDASPKARKAREAFA